MKKRTSGIVLGLVALGLICGVYGVESASAQVEEAIEARWYVSPFLGGVLFEGDEEVKDGVMFGTRIGYDFSEWWSFEGGFYYAPTLDENFRNELGVKISRLDEANDFSGVHDTSSIGLFVDALFHFTRWERLDPYLSLGGGFVFYSDDLSSGSSDTALRAGGGVMYHFNDEWAVRADGRMFIAGDDTEANATVDAGVVWTWGARVAQDYVAVGGPRDSDGDGLSDDREGQIGTNPHDPDTDKDGLSDGEEVLQYHTKPLDPDTDLDGLTDGFDEVMKYKTNPLERDTDKGGVSDGHEVIEDKTNPKDGSDDLTMFELYLQFDYDKAVIKPQYFEQLEKIATVLKKKPDSTARIEGHADKTAKSKEKYNVKLSERRARSVLEYLVTRGGIERSRMEALGYGFARPKVPNDPKDGNPQNRRVEVYIRGAALIEE